MANDTVKISLIASTASLIMGVACGSLFKIACYLHHLSPLYFWTTFILASIFVYYSDAFSIALRVPATLIAMSTDNGWTEFHTFILILSLWSFVMGIIYL